MDDWIITERIAKKKILQQLQNIFQIYIDKFYI